MTYLALVKNFAHARHNVMGRDARRLVNDKDAGEFRLTGWSFCHCWTGLLAMVKDGSIDPTASVLTRVRRVSRHGLGAGVKHAELIIWSNDWATSGGVGGYPTLSPRENVTSLQRSPFLKYPKRSLPTTRP